MSPLLTDRSNISKFTFPVQVLRYNLFITTASVLELCLLLLPAIFGGLYSSPPQSPPHRPISMGKVRLSVCHVAHWNGFFCWFLFGSECGCSNQTPSTTIPLFSQEIIWAEEVSGKKLQAKLVCKNGSCTS